MRGGKDYYSVLGVSRNSSPDEIKKAYRNLARKYHPDINPGDKTAEEKFKDVQEAYEILSNQEKKRAYDMFGEAGVRSGAGNQGNWTGNFGDLGEEINFGTSDFSGFEDIFGEIFGGRGSKRGHTARKPIRGRDVEYNIEIDFFTAINGGARDIKIARESNGKSYQSETLSVKIPQGVDQGSRIRISGKGEQGTNGGPRGDLYLKINIGPHPIFTRNKKDIHIDLPVTVFEAALGAEVKVPTIDGTANLKIPAGIQNGNKLRLKGKGVLNPKTKERGDQYVNVIISMPENLTESEKRIFKDLSEKIIYNPRTNIERYTRE